MIKPRHLKRGDTVCTVSLSWGGAGDESLLWRYNLGKERLEKQFGLKVVEMPHTLSGSNFVYNNPQKRAEDLMLAFRDPEIKAIFSCIGGNDSIRMLPYIDFEVIRSNPKIFIGYSDSTITHLICHMAGLSSFYGASVLAELSENNKIFDYTATWMDKCLFTDKIIGKVSCSETWTGDYLPWSEENRFIDKNLVSNRGYILLQGKGQVSGRLIGGCLDVLEMAKGTLLFPEDKYFDNAIFFMETSEETAPPAFLEDWLRNYATIGILQRLSGIIFAKPYQEIYFKEYQQVILKVLKEINSDIPVFFNGSFGHNEPMCLLPYGAMAKLDCENMNFEITESACQ